MAEWSGFFDAHKLGDSWDRTYLAEDFAKFFAPLIGNGVFAGKSNELQVFQSVPAGMSVVLSSGQSWIEGYGYTNDSDLIIPIDPADGVLGRIDRIVNQWSAVDRQIRTVWKKGIPAVNPVAPDLRWDADYKELNLCTLDVSAGLAAITQDKIRDTRADSSVCGWVTGLIDQVDTATLFAQWEAAYEKEFTEQKTAWEEFFEDIQLDLGIPVPSPDETDKVLSVDANGKYVLSDRYPKKNDVGNLPMDNHRVTDVAAPEEDGDAVNLGYTKKVGNPHNLLDNSDFRNPVNQRGKISSNTDAEYVIDRWFIGDIWTSGTCRFHQYDGNITFHQGLFQRVAIAKNRVVGKTFTLALHTPSGTYVMPIALPIIVVNGQDYPKNDRDINGVLRYYDDMGCLEVRFESAGDTECFWAALYEGEYTVETLPEYQPKGYGVELVECMRYYQVFAARARSVPGSTNVICYPFQFAMPMRIAPTVTSLTPVENAGIGADMVTPYGASLYVVDSASGDGILKASFSADL